MPGWRSLPGEGGRIGMESLPYFPSLSLLLPHTGWVSGGGGLFSKQRREQASVRLFIQPLDSPFFPRNDHEELPLGDHMHKTIGLRPCGASKHLIHWIKNSFISFTCFLPHTTPAQTEASCLVVFKGREINLVIELCK